MTRMIRATEARNETNLALAAPAAEYWEALSAVIRGEAKRGKNSCTIHVPNDVTLMLITEHGYTFMGAHADNWVTIYW